MSKLNSAAQAAISTAIVSSLLEVRKNAVPSPSDSSPLISMRFPLSLLVSSLAIAGISPALAFDPLHLEQLYA
ncbi:MAG: hypothetical protein AAGF75_02585, partial [Cyanobacteria bacterium P01_H01_bin.130]